MPPPTILLMSLLFISAMESVAAFIDKVMDKEGCGDNFTPILMWALIAVMSFLIVFLKWKETENPVFVITTFFVFWATIFGVERYPFACHIGDGGGIYEIFRAGVCMLITFIYTVWCKGEIDKFFEKLDVHVPAPSSGGPLPF